MNFKTNTGKSTFLKFRIIIILLTFFLLSSYTIGYAVFNQTLEENGRVTVVLDDADVVITEVSAPSFHKDGTINKTASYSGNSVDFAVQLQQTNTTITYKIKMKNMGSANARFARTEEVSSNDAIIYTLKGIGTSIILAPEEEIEFELVIHYSDEYKYNFPLQNGNPFKNDETTLSFIFEPTLRNPLIPITGSILEDKGNVLEYPLGAKATITLRNDNDFAVDVTLSTYRAFTIYDKVGVERSFHLEEHSENQFIIYIKDNDRAISSTGMTTELFILASVSDYGSIKTSQIDSITLQLETKGKYQILSGGFEDLTDSVSFENADTSTGRIYATTGLDGNATYFYRGAVTNNYFEFAGYTWRILRIDENANIRLVLDSLLTNSRGTVITQKYKTTNSASSLEDAKKLLRIVNDKSSNDTTSIDGNSPLYGYESDTSTDTLRGWYNNTIAGTEYEQYVVDSVFCQDTEQGTATSSGSLASVNYFGGYQRVGKDTELYEPTYTCPADNILIEKIGLMSIDEVVFAGGAFQKSNTRYFLYNSSITQNWWTLSPSYYDPSLNTVGAFLVETDGSTVDWVDNTINTAYGIRPVITVKGTLPLSGTGEKDNAYKFVE